MISAASLVVSSDAMRREVQKGKVRGRERATEAASRDDDEGVAFRCEPGLLVQMKMLNLVTDFGSFDLAFQPAAFDGFDDLSLNATEISVDGVAIPTAALNDVIESKERADRPMHRKLRSLGCRIQKVHAQLLCSSGRNPDWQPTVARRRLACRLCGPPGCDVLRGAFQRRYGILHFVG